MPIYLDYAAATPVDEQVVQAMAPYWTERFYNPSAVYMPAIAVKKELEQARAQVALLLGCRAHEIIFTAGATEANNLTIRGVMEQYPDSNVVVSSIEHDSVLLPARLYAHAEIAVSPLGLVDESAVLGCVNDKTVLISVMYANNEVGTVQPIRQITQAVQAIRRERRKAGNTLPLYVHTDAAQAANYLDIHVSRLGVDFMTLNGGKIYGPKQSGILFAASGTQFKPQIIGGGHERGRRGGTENVAGSIGFATALAQTQALRAAETARLYKLQQLFMDLLEERIPAARINGSRKQRIPNNVHITIPGRDNERLLMQLDGAGILAAAGSACSASSEEASHVLRAMGIADEVARASLRFTMGRQTNETAIRHTVDVLAGFVDAH